MSPVVAIVIVERSSGYDWGESEHSQTDREKRKDPGSKRIEKGGIEWHEVGKEVLVGFKSCNFVQGELNR